MRSLARPTRLLLSILVLIAAASCHLDPPAEEKHYLGLAVPDSLADYDTVRVRLIREGDTVEALWNGPLPHIDSLAKLPSGTYGGGRIDVLVEGLRQGDIQYRVLVRVMDDGSSHELDKLPLPPDRTPPILTLNGPDSLRLLAGEAYEDSGATCWDLRDGGLKAVREGSVPNFSAGIHILIYRCADAAGNAADSVVRKVRIDLPPDTTAAALALKGPAELAVWVGGTLSDTGATCLHPVRGALPVATEGKAALDTPGVYTLRYTCEVKPGRIEAVSQDVRVKPILVEIPILKEAEIDTFNNIHHNMGYNASGAFLPAEGDEHVILMQFDLSRVKLEGLKSAEAVFQTFGNGDWKGDTVPVTLHVYRVKSAWIEGTGNWFWHAGGWRNSGGSVFKHYPLSDSVQAKSTDPSAGTGVTGAQKSLVRKSNMVSMGTRRATVAFTSEEAFRPGPAGFVPPKERLTPLSIDFTEYVKTVPADQDFGFVIVVEDLAPPMHISWLTKEAGDGSFGAKLVLRY